MACRWIPGVLVEGDWTAADTFRVEANQSSSIRGQAVGRMLYTIRHMDVGCYDSYSASPRFEVGLEVFGTMRVMQTRTPFVIISDNMAESHQSCTIVQ